MMISNLWCLWHLWCSLLASLPLFMYLGKSFLVSNVPEWRPETRFSILLHQGHVQRSRLCRIHPGQTLNWNLVPRNLRHGICSSSDGGWYISSAGAATTEFLAWQLVPRSWLAEGTSAAVPGAGGRVEHTEPALCCYCSAVTDCIASFSGHCGVSVDL